VTPGSLRLFCALELPSPALRALQDFQARAADPEVWRPVPAASLHVTLAFLGATDGALAGTLEAALRAAVPPGTRAPRLALGGALLLPPRRPRVLCAAVEDLDGALGELQSQVSGALASTGAFVPEDRPFRPHVTVARLRARARAPRTVAAAPEPVAFHGGPVTLFASRTLPDGARYEPLVSLGLEPGRIDD
jgi:2'-5' RNA ligase